jgi:hypothetical protein
MAHGFRNSVRIAHSANYFHSVRETPGTHRSSTAKTVRSWRTVQWNGSHAHDHAQACWAVLTTKLALSMASVGELNLHNQRSTHLAGGWRDEKKFYKSDRCHVRQIALIEQLFRNLAGHRDRSFCERPSLDAHVATGLRPVNFIMLATKLLDCRR